jgi:hypothetical protein
MTTTALNGPDQPPTSLHFTCILYSPEHHSCLLASHIIHVHIAFYHSDRSLVSYSGYRQIRYSDNMKTSLALAASTLLGSASAGVHRMKLEKIPFDQQLVRPRSYVHFQTTSRVLSLARLLTSAVDRKAQTLATSPAPLPINMAPRGSSASHQRISFATLPSMLTRTVTSFRSRIS